MRILMTTDTVGGVWRFTEELVAGLLGKHCEISLVSLGSLPSPTQSLWVDEMRRRWPQTFEYTATSFPLEWMAANDFAYDDAARLLLKLARNFQPDLIHSNQFCFGALQISIPKVVTAHSDVLSWSQACHTHPLQQSAWLDRYCDMLSAGLAGASAVTAPTQWMLHSLLSNFALPAATHVIPNGRSLNCTTSAPRKLQAVTAGRLWDQAKNIAILGEFKPPIPLFAAGEASRNSQVAPVLSDVTLLGSLSESDLLSLFLESAIYICTSKYEPFGLAPLEAALCGCAILANDIASLREVWQEAPLYFDSATSLNKLLFALKQSPSLLKKVQARSLKQAKRYTGHKMTASYLALFQQVLTQSQSREMADVA